MAGYSLPATAEASTGFLVGHVAIVAFGLGIALSEESMRGQALG